MRLVKALVIGCSLVLILVSCGGGDEMVSGGASGQTQTGQVTVLLHDQAAPQITEAWVTFTAIAVSDTSGVFTALPVPPEPINVMAWIDPSNPAVLTQSLVPAGDYTGLRVQIGAIRLVTGTGEVNLAIPEGGISILVTVPFTVGEGGTVEISLDFDVPGSFQMSGTGWTATPHITLDPNGVRTR